MFRSMRIPVAVTLLTAVVALAGCGGSSQPAPSPASQPAAAPAPAPAAPPKPDLKFGIVTSRSGNFEAWGTDFLRGFEIGLDYATNGTRTVNGRKITLVTKDDQGKPDVGKQMAIEAFEKDQVDLLFGTISSGVAAAITPLLEQYKKVMIVEPAASDDITGKNYTRYVFRTASNASQDALAGGLAVLKMGKNIGMLAPDYDWGKSQVDAWGAVLKAGGGSISQTFMVPQDATDFLPYLKKVESANLDALIVAWSNAQTAPKLYQQIGLEGLYQKVKVSGGIGDRRGMSGLPEDMVGMVKYYYTLPKNPVNDYLVSEYKKRFNDAPELFSAGGMAAAIAAVEGLKKTGGDADAEKLIAAMEGMSFQGPKGAYTFRKEDHQALQTMYVVQMKRGQGYDFPTPTLVQELKPEETAPPINNKK